MRATRGIAGALAAAWLAAACSAGDVTAATHGNGHATGNGAATGVRPLQGAAAGAGRADAVGRLPADVSGTVGTVTEDALVFSDGRRVRIAPQTRFVADGKAIARQEVQPGADVRASFDPGIDVAYATEVVVTGRPARR